MIDQEVGRFDVAMEDPHAVGIFERLGRLEAQSRRLDRAEAARAVVSPLDDHLGERSPGDHRHREVMDTTLVSRGEERDDVRMIERRDRVGLHPEACELAIVRAAGPRQDLQGHAPSQGDLLGLVDHRHPAPADHTDDPEVTQPVALRTGQTVRVGEFRLAAGGEGQLIHDGEGRDQVEEGLGVLGMFGGEDIRIEGLAGPPAVDEFLDQVGEGRLVASGPGPDPQAASHRTSSSRALSRRNARRCLTLAVPSRIASDPAISAIES